MVINIDHNVNNQQSLNNESLIFNNKDFLYEMNLVSKQKIVNNEIRMDSYTLNEFFSIPFGYQFC